MFEVKWHGREELKGYLEAQRKNQLPFALATGLNDVAFEIRTAQVDPIHKVFDRPKPQTTKNVFVRKATKRLPMAMIVFDQIYDKGLDEYMVANVSGGARKMKPSEQRLGRFFVPGIGAKMDQYGNMQGGQITQILSRLGRFGDVAGYNMNQTAASRKRRARGGKSTEYFILPVRRGGLAPGVYQRTEKRGGFTSVGAPRAVRGKPGAFQKGSKGMVQGKGAVPVVLFTKQAPKYRAIWPYYQAAQDVSDRRMVPLMEAAIERALNSAR